MYPGYTLCERQKKILFEIGKLIFEIRKQVLCKHLWPAGRVHLGRIQPLLSCRYTEVVLATRYRGCWYYLFYFLLLFAVLSCYEVQEVIYTLCTIIGEDYINLVLSGTTKKYHKLESYSSYQTLNIPYISLPGQALIL